MLIYLFGTHLAGFIIICIFLIPTLFIEKNSSLFFSRSLSFIIISLFIEIWPIKSTGSFFTTWGATYFWITVALLISEKNRYFNQKF